MAWTVIIEDESRCISSPLRGEFSEEILHNIEDNALLRILKYLDPYGDLILNRLQMDDLISDLINLKNTKNYDDQIDVIINMAKECKNEHHLFLTFYGD